MNEVVSKQAMVTTKLAAITATIAHEISRPSSGAMNPIQIPSTKIRVDTDSIWPSSAQLNVVYLATPAFALLPGVHIRR